MSSVLTPQRDRTPPEPAGRIRAAARRLRGPGAHHGMGGDRGGLGTARRRPGGHARARGWWGIARDNSMGNDEVATRWAALLPLRELVHLLSNVDAVHGLYYLLMHGWVALGSSPVALRIPSVIAMAVAAVLVTIIGRRLTGSGWAGLFA